MVSYKTRTQHNFTLILIPIYYLYNSPVTIMLVSRINAGDIHADKSRLKRALSPPILGKRLGTTRQPLRNSRTSPLKSLVPSSHIFKGTRMRCQSVCEFPPTSIGSLVRSFTATSPSRTQQYTTNAWPHALMVLRSILQTGIGGGKYQARKRTCAILKW